MQLVLHNPFRELLHLAAKNPDDLLDDEFALPRLLLDEPAVDMYVEGDTLAVEAALPHFNKEEVRVTTDDTGIIIEAEHKGKTEDDTERQYLLHESRRLYKRHLCLPEGADTDEIKTSFKEGTLKLTLPLLQSKTLREVAAA